MEVAWCLSLALELEIALSDELRTKLESSASSVIVVLAKLLSDRNLLGNTPFKPLLSKTKPSSASFLQEKWLFYYEAVNRGWFGWTTSLLGASPLLAIAQANITFIDGKKRIPSIIQRKKRAGRIDLRTMSLEELNSFFSAHAINSGYGVERQHDENEEDDEDDEEELALARWED